MPGAEPLMLTIIQKDIVTVRNTVGNFSALGGTLAYLSVKENTKSSIEDLPFQKISDAKRISSFLFCVLQEPTAFVKLV